MENENLIWTVIEYDNMYHNSNNRGVFVNAIL
jgi:hypothetical protein